MVYCVNDAAVMSAWADHMKIAGSNLTFLCDPRLELTKALGETTSDAGCAHQLGLRIEAKLGTTCPTVASAKLLKQDGSATDAPTPNPTAVPTATQDAFDADTAEEPGAPTSGLSAPAVTRVQADIADEGAWPEEGSEEHQARGR